MKQKIKRLDKIIILTGKDKGKIGIVKHILKSKKVIIDGLNINKKHRKNNPSLNIIGGIIKQESPIHISNISLFKKK